MAISQILRTAERSGFKILAYTFMPDHVHLLVEGRAPSADLRRFGATLRRSATAACWHWVHGGLWQDGYYERTLRDSDGTQQMIDYILNNPVRPGIVERPTEFPYSWSITVGT
jgi:putative transposase